MPQKSEIERLAALEAKMDRVEKDIHGIYVNISELKALANQGRGSLRTFLWMGGLAAASVGLIGTLVGFFTGIKN